MKTKIRMVALRAMYYDRDIKAGEEFDVEEKFVHPLRVTGAAKEVVDDETKSKRYNRRDMRAEN